MLSIFGQIGTWGAFVDTKLITTGRVEGAEQIYTENEGAGRTGGQTPDAPLTTSTGLGGNDG